MIGIVDYGVGNIKAFAHVYNELNVPCVVARTAEDLRKVSRIILPGVGAFDEAMRRLQQSGLRDELEELVLHRQRPVMGVCVGMQMLASASEEGQLPGLGWIDGKVVRFGRSSAGEALRVPHMGWNDVRALRNGELFEGLEEGARFYFLHSYFMVCTDREDALAVAEYGDEFVCAVAKESIYGVQFHPEKSHRYGIRLLKNFSEL